jgi:osmoprotectant transport system permease protein
MDHPQGATQMNIYVNAALQHAYLVFMAAGFILTIGLSLGIASYMIPGVRKPVLLVLDLFQTIPSLATLGFLVVLVGANATTVIIGLIMYSLLPVVKNTLVGLDRVDPGIKEAAQGMGMPRWKRLVRVELPLAFPMVYAGMRIALVTSIGFAVFGAIVGGGGLGTLLYRGVRNQNLTMILTGTLTLMILSVIIDGTMGWIEKTYLIKETKTPRRIL